jgi:probable HAF family extracellular repeat protein
VAIDINAGGVIVGYTASRAFVYRDATWTDLNTLVPKRYRLDPSRRLRPSTTMARSRGPVR